MIPEIDISALFDDDDRQFAPIDREIWNAACHVGFMTVVGFPASESVGHRARASLLRLFQIRGEKQRRLWKKNFAPENPNLYRGWFPLESGESGAREGFEIGPDLVRALPADAADYYRGMEEVGYAILAALGRSIGLPDNFFQDAFRDGISTLRLLHYPARDREAPIPEVLDNYLTTWRERRAEIVCGGHVDSGLVTILAQCDSPGLQARSRSGAWVDVPVKSDALVINFGGLLTCWTGGRVRATQHRVLSFGEERYSIPFFFEPRPDAIIAPLPIDGVEAFEPFQFGDHLWATTTKFPENYGLGHLRPARAPYTDPFAKS